MATVILGGGIIGLSTAYYLSLSQSSKEEIHIIDSSSKLLESASGYAGGFLALDWFVPAASDLGALSFRLHRELAEEHNGQHRWGYAGSHCYSLAIDEHGVGKTEKQSGGVDWLIEGTSRAEAVKSNTAIVNGTGEGAQRGEMVNDDGTPAWITPQPGGTVSTIAGPNECGQIEPRELCEFLLSECQSRGVQVHLSSKATRVLKDKNHTVSGLEITSLEKDGEEENKWQLECQNILLAAGAWTPGVFKTLFPQNKTRIPIDPLAGYALVARSPRYKQPFISPSKRKLKSGEDEQVCYAIYCPPTKHWRYSPEAYARLARQGQTEIWIGGINDASLPLPELATDSQSKLDPKKIKELRDILVHISGLSQEGEDLNQDDLETIRGTVCFRPVSRTATPIVSEIGQKKIGLKMGKTKVWIASGHGPWGIAMSLGTGLVMSEMIQGKTLSADISRLAL